MKHMQRMVSLKRFFSEANIFQIEYLDSSADKNADSLATKEELHYVIDENGTSESVQYIIMESPSHKDAFSDIIDDCPEANDVRDQSDDENILSLRGKEVKPKILYVNT